MSQIQTLKTIAGHEARFDARGRLLPWTPWNAALEREMRFYRSCPRDRGYPRFAYVTFLDRDWVPHRDRTDTIPSTQIGMGILSYLKYHDFAGRGHPEYVETACAMADYLTQEALTPDTGAYPRFTRSTGTREKFPQPEDCGSQADRPHEIEPDKGGIAGYALLRLFEQSGRRTYLDQALQNARCLSANQRPGGAAASPWPFRADFRSGEGRGPVSGSMSFVLRLYDALHRHGYPEFDAPRAALWRWIRDHQIPSALGDGALFAQFFEDHDTPTNRTAWGPLNLARYLLEGRETLDPEWLAHAGALIEFVRRTFTHVEAGLNVCHEQDEDPQAWGGINSTYGAVLALYAKASDSEALAREAEQALTYTLYCIDAEGRPRDVPQAAAPGGWQEDAHTDVIHNYIDAAIAYPEWAT